MPTQNNSTEPPDAVASQAGFGSKQKQTPLTDAFFSEYRSGVLIKQFAKDLEQQNTALKAALESAKIALEWYADNPKNAVAIGALADITQALAAAKGEKV